MIGVVGHWIKKKKKKPTKANLLWREACRQGTMGSFGTPNMSGNIPKTG